MKAAPYAEKVGRFRWVATQPMFGSPHLCGDGTCRVPVACQCAIGRTKWGAMRGLRNHPITPILPTEALS